MNQSCCDSCDCYQYLSLWNSDIHMSSMHAVGFEVVTSSTLASDMVSNNCSNMYRKHAIPQQHNWQRCNRSKINDNLLMHFPFEFDEHNTSGGTDVQDYNEWCSDEVGFLNGRTCHLFAEVVRNTKRIANAIEEKYYFRWCGDECDLISSSKDKYQRSATQQNNENHKDVPVVMMKSRISKSISWFESGW